MGRKLARKGENGEAPKDGGVGKLSHKIIRRGKVPLQVMLG